MLSLMNDLDKKTFLLHEDVPRDNLQILLLRIATSRDTQWISRHTPTIMMDQKI